MDSSPSVRTERSWEELASGIRDMSGERLVYVVGAGNRGKTTFCRYLVRSLSRGSRVAYIDCDPGQSSIGPPATIAVQGVDGSGDPAGEPVRYFIGSVSPRGHLLECLSGTKRLAEKAIEKGFRIVVIDSSGFVLHDAAREFQFHVIDLVQPDFLVAFQRGHELEELLGNFSRNPRITLRRMRVSPRVKIRGTVQRREHRRRMFESYFQQALIQRVSTRGRGVHGAIPEHAGTGEPEGLLAAICDREHFVLAVGITVSYDPGQGILSLLAPPFDAEASATIHFGSVSLDPSEYRQVMPPISGKE